MHARCVPPPALVALARLQDGVVTAEQAVGLGLGRRSVRRLVDEGSWQRISSGVYFVSSWPIGWSATAWAGVLIGGDHARVGGLAAAHLHGLVREEPVPIHILVPPTSRPKVEGPWRFVRERDGWRSPRSIGSPPRLRIEDVVLDLVDSADDDREVVGWVTTAIQDRLTTPDRLRHALQRRHRIAHRAVLEAVIGDTVAGARSPLEVRYLREVERAHELPRAQRQIKRRGTESDVWYREFGVLVELDGRRGHERRGVFRDMRRDNAATTDGLATLRYGYRDVIGSPCEVAMQVAQVLADHGWLGPFVRCHRCARAA